MLVASTSLADSVAYEAAMSGPRAAIGAGRVRPGSVAAVIAEYLDS